MKNNCQNWILMKQTHRRDIGSKGIELTGTQLKLNADVTVHAKTLTQKNSVEEQPLILGKRDAAVIFSS